MEAVRKPAEGGVTDSAVVDISLQTVRKSFAALEALLPADAPSSAFLGDLYLFPMLDYGLRVEAAAELAADLPLLKAYWQRMRNRQSVHLTNPADFTAILPHHALA